MVKPEDKPMKKQWLEVDGRMTLVILPQIWSHDLEDWVVTSEQNPLPTQVTGSSVEYENAIPVKRIESNLEIIKESITLGGIPAGEIKVINIEPTKGFVYDLLNIGLDIRGSDNVLAEFGRDSVSAVADRLIELENEGTSLRVVGNSVTSGKLISPLEQYEIYEIIKSIWISRDNKMVIRVRNRGETDVTTALLKVSYKKEKVVEYE